MFRYAARRCGGWRMLPRSFPLRQTAFRSLRLFLLWIIEIRPGPDNFRKLGQAKPESFAGPFRSRLVRYNAGSSTISRADTLPNSGTDPASKFADLYGTRWGIAGVLKISKSIMEIAPFYARTERSIRQELCALLNFITMTRICTDHSDAVRNARKRSLDTRNRSADFKNLLAAVDWNLEAVLLMQAATVAEAAQHILDCAVTATRNPG